MIRASFVLCLALLAAGCHSSTSPDSDSPSRIAVFSSASAAGPWGTAQDVSVTGHDAVSLVDQAPIRMPDGSILMYYLMSYQGDSDPIAAQPNNQWKLGVARSISPTSFVHQGVVYTSSIPAGDPFPMQLDAAGNMRLFFTTFANIAAGSLTSLTSTDATGLHFGGVDPGVRTTALGSQSALKIGSTYFLYHGPNYSTSTDGLTFTPAGPLGINANFESVIDAGDGTYLMAYVCENLNTAETQVTCMASSPDGRNWTQVARVGTGGVPGLVKDASGMLRIYVLLF